jgi:hypothetical protein
MEPISMTTVPKSWEGIFFVPGLRLDACPWCHQSSDKFFVVIYEIRIMVIESELVCEQCTQTATQFVEMRKSGLSRKAILKDFDFQR